MYRFLVRRPGVRISLLTLLNHEVLAAAREHRVDLWLGLAPASHGGVRVERLCQSDLVCIMPPDDQLTMVDRVTIPALAPFR
ncbi:MULTISPECIES: LysR substrate-binding domain-containing protein [Acidiphilium]|uniref:LysR substrate binding domain-containing protein n=1 Tax=Acidiphilium rubrum TaxID=526 RepID=A0A8G2CNG0_ACIRU|nr:MULTISPECIES: LysR substrate-binding domain-containing protein [Acidiphilium]SIR43319.1 LysR substrate binding domain-containing protein [Acidiphilium rubrum]